MMSIGRRNGAIYSTDASACSASTVWRRALACTVCRLSVCRADIAAGGHTRSPLNAVSGSNNVTEANCDTYWCTSVRTTAENVGTCINVRRQWCTGWNRGPSIPVRLYCWFLVAPLAAARRYSSSHDSPIEARPYTARYSSFIDF